MSPELIAAIVSAIGVIGGAIAWGIKHISKQFGQFLRELKPNGGSSIKDQVTRLDLGHDKLNNRIDTVDAKIDMLINAFNDYIKGK